MSQPPLDSTSSTVDTPLNALPPPGFWKRVFCILYEQLILLGVIALLFLLPNLVLGIVFGFSLPSWLTFFYLYAVLALYFVWYWTRTGQTLAMQTWRVKLVSVSGARLTRRQALWRYVYGSLWLVPCILIQASADLQKWGIISLLFAVSLFLWPLSIYLDPRHRQSIPDRLGKTKLISLPKMEKRK
jgi:uncharacterized RDD family membrane protein YckC